MVHPLAKKLGDIQRWSSRQGGKEKQISDTVGGRVQVIEPMTNHNTDTELVIL